MPWAVGEKIRRAEDLEDSPSRQVKGTGGKDNIMQIKEEKREEAQPTGAQMTGEAQTAGDKEAGVEQRGRGQQTQQAHVGTLNSLPQGARIARGVQHARTDLSPMPKTEGHKQVLARVTCHSRPSCMQRAVCAEVIFTEAEACHSTDPYNC